MQRECAPRYKHQSFFALCENSYFTKVLIRPQNKLYCKIALFMPIDY